MEPSVGLAEEERARVRQSTSQAVDFAPQASDQRQQVLIEPHMADNVPQRPLPVQRARGDNRQNITYAGRRVDLPPGYLRVQMTGKHFHVLDAQGARILSTERQLCGGMAAL